MIKVKDLTKKFNGFTAVDKVSFNVSKGEIFAFLGPNGAGKTTIIKILTTLLSPTSGQISLNGYDVLTQPDKVRRSFGIVFQDQSLDEELTVLENMEFHGVLYSVPKKIRKERIEELLNIVELWDRRREYVKKFSGGMKRRLEIARGLLHHPKVLFLDEPTLGLDPQTRKHIWSYIVNLNKKEGITIFFTTHYIEEAGKIAERIAVINQGKIIIQGTPKELMKKTGTTLLEDAFIKLTGHNIRNEQASSTDHMRMIRRTHGH